MEDACKWLSNRPQEYLSTPYSRDAHAHYILSPFALVDGSVKQVAVSRDGQIFTISLGKSKSMTVDSYKWRSFILDTITRLRSLITKQLPSGLTYEDLASTPLHDDFSLQAPYRQAANRMQVMEAASRLDRAMRSESETNHTLFRPDGTVDKERFESYIYRDQEIRGVLASLASATSPLPLRSAQFSSIAYDSDIDMERNMWILGDRFVYGRPKAKQYKGFANVMFCFPCEVTLDLMVLLYYQQPYISSLSRELETRNDLYDTLVWSYPSINTEDPSARRCWNGSEINAAVKSLSKEFLGVPLDPPLMRQLGQGILRHKTPTLLQIWQDRSNIDLEEGTYRFKSILQAYASRHKIHPLAQRTGMEVELVSQCLIVTDIWMTIQRISEPDSVWAPMVANSYIFPSTRNDTLAHLTTRNHKTRAQLQHSGTLSFNLGSLVSGVKLLQGQDLSNLKIDVSLCPHDASYPSDSYLCTEEYQQYQSQRSSGWSIIP